jgi:YhcH/YjgK/YiaL family protein
MWMGAMRRLMAPGAGGGDTVASRLAHWAATMDWTRTADGRIEMGHGLFALVSRAEGRGRAQAPLEIHRRYADVQLVIEGREVIGWREASDCRSPRGPVDEDSDIGFFNDTPVAWMELAPGQAAVFMPDDAHAPLAGEGPVRKAVIKVPAERWAQTCPDLRRP